MKRILKLMTLAMAISLLASCGTGPNQSSSDRTSVTLTFQVPGAMGSSGADFSASAVSTAVKSVKVTVSAVDMETMIKTIPIVDGVASETVDITSGYARTFLIEPVDAFDNTMYTGTTMADLLGDPITLSVTVDATFTTVNINLYEGLSPAAFTPDVADLRITVTGLDLNTVTGTVATSTLSGPSTMIDITDGLNRTFIVDGLDVGGNALYTGSATSNLSGVPVFLDVDMVHNGTSVTLSLVDELDQPIAVPADVTKIMFDFSASDMLPVSHSFTPEINATVTATFDVLTGSARTFTVSAYDSVGNLIGAGEAFSDLAGEPVSLNVRMYSSLSTTSTLMTDSSWKASTAYQTGWTGTSFDDSAWSYAGQKQLNCSQGSGGQAPDSSLSYIWYPSLSPVSRAYFRKSFYLVDGFSVSALNIVAFDDYEVYINGTLAGSNIDGSPSYPATQYSVGSLLNKGLNTIAIYGYDTSPTCGSAVFAELLVGEEGADITAPSVPAGLVATAASESQINLSWSASTDNSGVAGYNVYRFKEPYSSVADTTYFFDTGLSSAKTYCYSVSAYDAAGNESSPSVEVCASTTGTKPISERILGSWGMVKLRGGSTWGTESVQITFNAVGTGAYLSVYNEGGIRGTESKTFTYSVSENADGTFNLQLTTTTGQNVILLMAASDDGETAIVNGTLETGQPYMMLGTKLDPTKTYSASDVSGIYYLIGYEFMSAPRSNTATSGLCNADGNGSITLNETINSNNVISSDTSPLSYQINPRGWMAIESAAYTSFLGGDNSVAMHSNPDSPDSYDIHVLMKAADKAYSSSDLQGVWVLTGIGDDNGNPLSVWARMTCNSVGNCSVSGTKQQNGVISAFNGGSAMMGVARDGSFGGNLGAGSPSIAGVIGKDGSMVFINMSYLMSTHREILTGVKCSACTP